MPNHPNNYSNTGLTGKNPRKQTNVSATVLMVPFLSDEGHEHGEDISKRENRINDQTKSGKRRGAMLLTQEHGMVIAQGSNYNSPWSKFKFDALKTIQPA